MRIGNLLLKQSLSKVFNYKKQITPLLTILSKNYSMFNN